MQSLGAAPALSIGAGVIGDVFRLEERGGALGIFFAVGTCWDVSTMFIFFSLHVRLFLLDLPQLRRLEVYVPHILSKLTNRFGNTPL
jgi:hypothetical protein